MFLNKVLDKNRIAVLEKLKPFLKEFPINGGTGLALNLGHRISYDFDLFSNKPLPKFFDRKLIDIFPDAKFLINNSDEITFTIDDIKVTFLFYPFESLESPIYDNGIYTASIDDLVANKFYVIGRRSEVRDYIDIFFILQENNLEKCIDITKQKYGELISAKSILGQLRYFDDLNYNDPVLLTIEVPFEQIKEKLISVTNDYIHKHLANK